MNSATVATTWFFVATGRDLGNFAIVCVLRSAWAAESEPVLPLA